MIIAGFPGIGKSTLAKQSRWVDLESTPFERDWDRYAKVAKHMSNNGYNVLVSTHPEFLQKLLAMKIRHTVVVPDPSCKDEYVARYIERGSSPEFIDLVSQHFEEWIRAIQMDVNDYRAICVLHPGIYLSGAVSMEGEMNDI